MNMHLPSEYGWIATSGRDGGWQVKTSVFARRVAPFKRFGFAAEPLSRPEVAIHLIARLSQSVYAEGPQP